MQLSSMGCLADNAKEQQKREGWDPLAEGGRLVVSAKRACECEKAGTHWLNVGASWSVPRGHVRDASQTMPKSMREREGRDPLAERGRLVVSAKRAVIARRPGPTG